MASPIQRALDERRRGLSSELRWWWSAGVLLASLTLPALRSLEALSLEAGGLTVDVSISPFSILSATTLRASALSGRGGRFAG